MKGLIVFLIPPQEVISGGIMSIFSLAAESRKLQILHNSKVYIAVYPGAASYNKNKLFKNSEIIYEFDQILTDNKDIDSLLIHIPEYEIVDILPSLNERVDSFPPNLHINILNQNIEHMPGPEIIGDLFRITANVTQTVAHQRYASQAVANKYSIPTHLLTVYLDESQYIQKDFSEKQKIILYSPDENADKARVLKALTDTIPNYKIQEINNVTYSEYKKLIANAAYTLTFGEGFDGYFIEPAFSGSIPIAVYNDTFFPSKKYKDLANVFSSYDTLERGIASLIDKMSPDKYKQLNIELTNELKKTYSRPVYIKNIELFYERKYTYKPTSTALLTSLTNAVKRDALKIRELQKSLTQSESNRAALEMSLEELNQELNSIKQSKAWRSVNELRKIIHPGK